MRISHFSATVLFWLVFLGLLVLEGYLSTSELDSAGNMVAWLLVWVMLLLSVGLAVWSWRRARRRKEWEEEANKTVVDQLVERLAKKWVRKP